MTRKEARRLSSGVYRVWWKRDGGVSVAAIGHLRDGSAWLAPANWVSVNEYGLHWRMVDRVEPIELSSAHR